MVLDLSLGIGVLFFGQLTRVVKKNFLVRVIQQLWILLRRLLLVVQKLLLFFLSHLDLPFELISAFFLTVNLGNQTKVFQKVIFIPILRKHFEDSNHFGVLRIDQGVEERSIVVLNKAKHGVLSQNLLLELSDLVHALFELPVYRGTVLVLVNIENALVVVLLRARVVLILLLNLLVLLLGLVVSL